MYLNSAVLFISQLCRYAKTVPSLFQESSLIPGSCLSSNHVLGRSLAGWVLGFLSSEQVVVLPAPGLQKRGKGWVTLGRPSSWCSSSSSWLTLGWAGDEGVSPSTNTHRGSGAGGSSIFALLPRTLAGVSKIVTRFERNQRY